MNIDPKHESLAVDAVTDAWNTNAIKANPEYQRGLAWTERQGKMLVDSVFRGYPLPRFYFQQKESRDPLGNSSIVLEVIDGQQRIVALTNFRNDHWPLFDPGDPKMHLPKAIRDEPCPWGGKLFSALPDQLRKQFLETQLPSVVIDQATTQDEVRDLFIRLQAGTALTRQQVRDAWPGNIGPFVEGLAGKMTRQPRFTLFGAVDKRGSGAAESDTDDRYHDSRQTCAQVLCLFLRRQRGSAIPTLTAAALDDLYYENTGFPTNSPDATAFVDMLGRCETVIDARPGTAQGKKVKVTKRELFALVLVLSDLMRNGNVNMDQAVAELVQVMWHAEPLEEMPANLGRVTSSVAIEAHFLWFLDAKVSQANVIGLDPQRFFAEEQKARIWANAGGVCGICKGEIDRDEGVEYDHVRPWLLGGRTDEGNGRPVHPSCHLRGSAALESTFW